MIASDPITEFAHLFSSSDCTTTPYRSRTGATDFRGIDNGYLKGGVAVSRRAKTYAAARICVAKNEIPNGSTPLADFRLCVWDYDEPHDLLTVTDNLADAMNAVPRFQDIQNTGGQVVEADFLEPITLERGRCVILGDATYGDYTLRNLLLASEACLHAMMRLEPQMGFRVIPTAYPGDPNHRPEGGYEGGIPGPIGRDGSSGNYPWMDLLA